MAQPHPPAGNQKQYNERPLKVFGEQYLLNAPLPIGAVINPTSGDLQLFTDNQPRVPLPTGWVVLNLTDWVVSNRYSGVPVAVMSAEEFAEVYGGGVADVQPT